MRFTVLNFDTYVLRIAKNEHLILNRIRVWGLNGRLILVAVQLVIQYWSVIVNDKILSRLSRIHW